jgi:hypothetical protein
MDNWITFWEIAYVVGLGSFFVLAVLIVPLGARDLVRLFKHLDRQTDPEPPTSEPGRHER